MGQRDRMLNDVEYRVRAMTLRKITRVEIDEGDGEPVTVKGHELKLDELLRRVRHLLTVDERVVMVDGYPTHTPGSGSPGGGFGGRTLAVPDGSGGHDMVPTTSTEAAALTLLERPGAEADPVHALASKALGRLRAVAVELEELDAVLGEFDRLRLATKLKDAPQCYVITEVLGLRQWDDLWTPSKTMTPKMRFDRSTLPDDKRAAFDEPRKVCSWVYWHIQNTKRMPSKSEARKYLESVISNRAKGRAS